MHTFPLPGWTAENKGEYQWTEWFASWSASADKMHDSNYAVPLTETKEWLDGNALLSPASIAATDRWLEEMSSVRPTPEQIIFQGTPWGGLHELIMKGKPLAAGAPFNITKVDATRPWIELLETGTFSDAVLAAVPLSFEISDFWKGLLEAGIKTGHSNRSTWLHHLYLGTALLERGDQAASTTHFQSSMAKHPNVHAARNLAVSAPTTAEARDNFLAAWNIYCLSAKTPSMVRLGENLAMELTIWLTYQAQNGFLDYWTDLEMIFADGHLTDAMRGKDRVLHAQAALALHQGETKAVQAIITGAIPRGFGAGAGSECTHMNRSHPGCCASNHALRPVAAEHCLHTFQLTHPASFVAGHCFPSYGSDRGKLIAMWEESYMMEEEIKLGRKLTLLDQVLVRRRLGCVGDSSGQGGGGHCNRGPPNIGYPY